MMTRVTDDEPPLPAADVPERVRTLVERYAGAIRRAVRRVAGPRTATIDDDIQQIVATSLWRQVQREQTIEAPSSYLYRAAIRETVRLVRREVQRCQVPIEIVEAAATSEGNPHDTLVRRQLGVTIEQALGELDDDRQQAVRAHLSGMTVQEIMQVHDWTYQRARNLIARGMADLRAALRARGIE